MIKLNHKKVKGGSMGEKVEILLATYNTEQGYLKKQIDSILKQTYDNFKLIISDDHSTKKEVKTILEAYQKQDERIELYVQERNLGYNKNFEFLLKQAKANYIMFCDHDDIWYPQKIEKCLVKMKEEKVDLVYCNANQINEKDEIIRQNYFQYKNVPLIHGKSKLAITRCIGIGCSQMITNTIKNKMLPFTDQVIAHDWLAAFLANEGNGIAYLEEPLFGYRLHTNNVFGGRSLAQNLSKWKEENGSSYQSYLKYRKEKVINKAYLEGAKMCLQYATNQENKKMIQQLIKYYEKLKNSKYCNIYIVPYFRFLAGRKLAKKMIKEIMIFHLPILGYLFFAI